MPRALQSLTPAKRVAIGAAAALALSLVPVRYTAGWTRPMGDLAVRLAAPVSHPVSLLSRLMHPAKVQPVDEGERLQLADAERFRVLYLRAMHENAQLRQRIEVLQGGLAVNPERPVALLGATVIGTGGDLSQSLLRIRRGTEVGIHPNTVATVRGTQLLGRVVHAARALSEIRPITDRAAGPILGRVVLRADGAGLACTLEPDGRGRLVGPVEDVREHAGLEGLRLEVGQTVRLADDAWPRHAQMLEIGRVARIEPSPESPLRRIITVEPAVDLARVSEIELRIEGEEEVLAGAGR